MPTAQHRWVGRRGVHRVQVVRLSPKSKCESAEIQPIPNLTELQHYADYWFDNRNQRSKNVIDLVIASLRYSNQGQRIFGSTLAGYSLSMVFKAAAINETQANDTAAHEIGHRFGLRKRNGGGFVHIDMSVSQTAHDSLDNCLMSYDRNRNDSSVEFCTNCLSGGSSPFATDSLRSTEDK